MDSRRLAEGGEWDLLRLRDVRPQTDRAHYGEAPGSSIYIHELKAVSMTTYIL